MSQDFENLVTHFTIGKLLLNISMPAGEQTFHTFLPHANNMQLSRP